MGVAVSRSANGWQVAGEIDAATSSELALAFRSVPRTANGHIEVDLEAVSFIDSSGLRLLIDLSNRLRPLGSGVVVRNPSPPVRRLLEITRLGDLFGLDHAVGDGPGP